MIEIISGMPDNTVAVVARGKVSGEDYEKVLIPAVEARLKTHKKIRFFYQLGEDYAGFTAAAIWDDAKLGLRHFTAFEKVAVVTDVAWIADSVKIFRVVMPCPVKVFRNEKTAEAKAWLSA